ncbi:ADP-ribosylglycohydrolase family protein [Planctomycetota bacterium]
MLRLPITDVTAPGEVDPVVALVRKILERLEVGKSVVIHFRGGLGRSGTIGGCVFMALGMHPEEALEELRKARGPNCPETPSQRQFNRDFSQHRAAWYESERPHGSSRDAAGERTRSLCDGPRGETGPVPSPRQSVILGCVLGAATGDAMGHPTESMSASAIRSKYGPEGVAGFEPWWEYGGPRFDPYTDDTQMAEAVLVSLLDGRDAGEDLDATLRSANSSAAGKARLEFETPGELERDRSGSLSVASSYLPSAPQSPQSVE